MLFSDVHLSKECLEYSTLDSLDRRRDQYARDGEQTSDDRTLSTSSWYRISGHAGNQIAMECVRHSRFACYARLQGWIRGNMPTVAEGRVDRAMCFRDQNNCCLKSKTITVRNCGSYFVYQFSTFTDIKTDMIPMEKGDDRYIEIKRAGKVCTEFSKCFTLVVLVSVKYSRTLFIISKTH